MLKHCQSARLYRRPSSSPYSVESDSVSLPGVERSDKEGSVKGEVLRVYAFCLGSEIEYKTLYIHTDTTVRDVVLTVLHKYRMMDKDPNLFYLTLELSDTNPSQEGLTKKTLVLDMDNRPVEFSTCHTWFDCKFILRMKMGGEVKIFISVLVEDREYLCLRISEDTEAEVVIRMLLHSFQMERETCGKYCLYEENLLRRYQRRVGRKERPLKIQKRWEEEMEGSKSFCFRLKLNPDIFHNKLYYVPIHM